MSQYLKLSKNASKHYYNELPPNEACNNFEVSYGAIGNGMI
jgi:hypothetical protein